MENELDMERRKAGRVRGKTRLERDKRETRLKGGIMVEGEKGQGKGRGKRLVGRMRKKGVRQQKRENE